MERYNKFYNRETETVDVENTTTQRVSMLESRHLLSVSPSVSPMDFGVIYCDAQSPSFPDKTDFPLTPDEIRDRLNFVRITLGLKVKTLASILRVECETMFGWTRGGDAPTPEINRRIRTLFSFANEWKLLVNNTAHIVLDVPLGENGETLLDVLTQDDLHEEGVYRLLLTAAAYVNEKQPHWPSVEESLREAGVNPEDYRISDEAFDAMVPKFHFSAENWE